MGMFDYVSVQEENSLGIKVGEYQTKSLNMALDNYEILPDGKLIITKHFTEGRYWNSSNKPYKYPAWCNGMDGMFTIYKERLQYDCYIENGIIVRVIENGDDIGGDIEYDDITWEYNF